MTPIAAFVVVLGFTIIAIVCFALSIFLIRCERGECDDGIDDDDLECGGHPDNCEVCQSIGGSLIDTQELLGEAFAHVPRGTELHYRIRRTLFGPGPCKAGGTGCGSACGSQN